MTEAEIRAVLAPYGLDRMLEGIHLDGGALQVVIAADRRQAAALEPRRREIEGKLAALPGLARAAVVFTAERPPAPPAEAAVLPGVRHAIAVASGKGGVGKSTLAVNLAVALARDGLTVGLLDADIYGPSLPRMLGLRGKPAVANGMLLPVQAFGLRCMSIGLMVAEDAAMIWRGPMVMGALTQLLTQVAWGSLDVLVIDLPPGTGDAQLTLAQKARLSGAVVVSTPQDIALVDARRAIAMFRQVAVPVLGIVENMSFFCCPNCNHRTEIFGHGGAAAEAARLQVPLLGEVPLLPAIRQTGDDGTPVVALAPDSAAGAAFGAVAAGLRAALAGIAPRGS